MKYPSLLAANLILLFASVGCAGQDSAALGAENDATNNGAAESPGALPESALYSHDVPAARDQFATKVDGGTATSRDFAGLAITEALNLPLTAEFNGLLLDHLGAARQLTNAVLYGENGLFYLVSLGVPWNDGEDLAGIETLLEGQLPWQRQRLASTDAFVEGLSRPVDLLVESLVTLVEGPVARIRTSAASALAGESFTFIVPGAVFHDEALEVTVGPSDLALLDAAAAFAQGAVYALGAYTNAWTLERVAGTSVWEAVIADPTHELHVAGATVEDYQVAHINENLLRIIEHPQRLTQAQSAFADVFGSLATAVERSDRDPVDSTLAWDSASAALSADIVSVLEAIESSLRSPTEIPFTEPSLTADLSPLFDEGRTVPPGTDIFVRQSYMDEFGEYFETTVSDAAFDILTEGLFTPALNGEVEVQFTLAEDVTGYVESLTGDYSAEVDRAYSRSF